MKNAETKENSQRRPNNNNVVIKHSQGPLNSFSRAIDNILSHILWQLMSWLQSGHYVVLYLEGFSVPIRQLIGYGSEYYL